VKGRLEVVERGDYVGDDVPQTDGEGRPVAQVVTHRDNGQDCTIFAPCATANGVNKEGADRGLD
jgi:glutamate dehydrogenase/leucine dehydrogenase